MKLRLAEFDLYIGYEVAAAMTAVLLLDQENRVICCFLAALLHELGHLMMMRLNGVRVTGLRLRLFDVLIEAQEPPTFKADVLVTLGGVGVNFILFAALCPFSGKLSLPHLMLGIFNLLPVMSLDGGHLLYVCLSLYCDPRVCDTVLRVTTFIFMLPLLCMGILLLLNSSYNYTLLAISLYLLALLFLKH